MEIETVECPVCDQKIPVDAVRCPKCNVVFSMSDIEELKRVALEISDPSSANTVTKKEDDSNDKGGKEKRPGIFNKLFGKKK
jgi:hypothetical protein